MKTKKNTALSRKARSAILSRHISMAVTLLVFLMAANSSLHGNVGQTEASILRWINGWPHGLWPFFAAITLLGSGWGLLAAVLLCIHRWGKSIGFVALATTLASALIASLTKILIGRNRPSLLLDNIIQRGQLVTGKGFPSGHTAVVVTLVTLLWPWLNKSQRWLLSGLAACVAISRIYLGVHAPLDIVGGACIGLFLGLFIKEKLVMQKLRTKKVASKPAKA